MKLLEIGRLGHRSRAWLIALALASSAAVTHAIPYATGVKLEGGVLTFILNENADSVKVIAGAVSKDLGALNKGTISTNLGISGAFRIEVSRSAAGGWVQTSDDNNIFVRFNSPRGVAVNKNPASPYFGRVYVANSAAGTTTGVVRSVGDGIYVLNADQSDALGQGNTALNGGANFSAGGTSSPYRVTVGEDDNLYICDWSDAAGNLIQTDPNLSAGSAKFVLKPLASASAPGNGAVPVGLDNTHGSVAAAVVLGSAAAGTLKVYTVDEDYQTDREAATATEINSIWEYTIGSAALPYPELPARKISSPAIAFVSQTMDLARGPNGFLYTTDRRSAGAQAGLQVVDPAEPDPALAVKFNSLDASFALGSTFDYLAESGAVTVSTDGKWVAVLRNATPGTTPASGAGNEVVLAPLVSGIPDLAARVTFPAFGATAAGRAIAFDAAGNLHVVSSGFGLYRVFSPGGTTVATTTSDGQFNVRAPFATVTVTASVPSTAEGSGTDAEFTLTRTDSAVAPLTVNVALSGTAENGSDYTTIPATITIPAGQASVTIPIHAIDDNVAEATEEVVLTVQGSSGYSAGNPGSAKVTIADNETPQLSISTLLGSAYERVADDYIRFKVTRFGDLTSEVTGTISLSGPGASSATASGTVTVLAGETSASYDVHPVDDNLLNGDRVVTATITAGAGYTVGTASANGTIVDDELPSEAGKILFADKLDRDTSAQWKVLFGAGNNLDDKQVSFAYDFVNNDAIPAAPGGATLGLKLTVNKFEGTALGSAAGVNLYPIGKSFSGDFALRFNMFIMQNGGAGTTEHATFGINMSGNKTNWVRQTTAASENLALDNDGLWAAIVADGSYVNSLGHVLYTGQRATDPAYPLVNVNPEDLGNAFKSPPYLGTTGFVGSPANTVASETKTWVDVEMKQVGGVVTVSINKNPILTYNNTTPYVSGDIMVGYNDQFDSIGVEGAVYINNLRVVDLSSAAPVQPNITKIAVAGGTVTIDFTGGTGDAASAFQVQGKNAITDSFAAENSASVTSVGAGQFRATVPAGGDVHFYRIRR